MSQVWNHLWSLALSYLALTLVACLGCGRTTQRDFVKAANDAAAVVEETAAPADAPTVAAPIPAKPVEEQGGVAAHRCAPSRHPAPDGTIVETRRTELAGLNLELSSLGLSAPLPLDDDYRYRLRLKVVIGKKTVLDDAPFGREARASHVEDPEVSNDPDRAKPSIVVRATLDDRCEAIVLYRYDPESKMYTRSDWAPGRDHLQGDWTISRRAEQGEVSAELSYSPASGDGFLYGQRIRIRRQHAVAMEQPLPELGGPAMAIEGPLLSDLDGDGGIDVLIHILTAGAYCCSHSVIYFSRSDGIYARLTHDWGNYRDLPVLRDLDDDHILEFVTGDSNFAGELGPYVITGARPLLILQLRSGQLTNVTKMFPKAIDEDARSWWTEFGNRKSDWFRSPVALAAFLADMHLLGRGEDGRQSARGALKGKVEAPFGGSMTPSAYLSMLETLLRKHKYSQ